mmetsp:Transcript_38018/g.81215  ORF Transcript_38018/g.81215 Transcript_38018/m.81215 type:complete len:366 (+) Transcript_38018:457-1554(+)
MPPGITKLNQTQLAVLVDGQHAVGMPCGDPLEVFLLLQCTGGVLLQRLATCTNKVLVRLHLLLEFLPFGVDGRRFAPPPLSTCQHFQRHCNMAARDCLVRSRYFGKGFLYHQRPNLLAIRRASKDEPVLPSVRPGTGTVARKVRIYPRHPPATPPPERDTVNSLLFVRLVDEVVREVWMVLHHGRQRRQEVAIPHRTLPHVVRLHGLGGGHHTVAVVVAVQPRRDPVAAHAEGPRRGREFVRGLPGDALPSQNQWRAALSIPELQLTDGIAPWVRIVTEGRILPRPAAGLALGRDGLDIYVVRVALGVRDAIVVTTAVAGLCGITISFGARKIKYKTEKTSGQQGQSDGRINRGGVHFLEWIIPD